jgi:hypothetical protein
MRARLRAAGYWGAVGLIAGLPCGRVGGRLLAQAPSVSAALTAEKAELRRLVSANEVFHARNKRYAANTAELAGFRAGAGITVVINGASATGWSATATSAEAQGKSCVIWVGAVTRPKTAGGLAGPEAVPTCDRP